MPLEDDLDDHDLLITLAADTRYLRAKLDGIDERLKTGDSSINEHGRAIAVLTQQTVSISSELQKKASEEELTSICDTVAKHIDGHWKFATIVIGLSSLAVAAVTLIVGVV